MTYEPTLQEITDGLESLQRRTAFEREMASTPHGKTSFELREAAHELHARGEAEQAFALCDKAAAMFSANDPSAAAAMAWYDLARSYEFRADGVKEENLRNAEMLFRRALASPALVRDPHRMATTRDALASCLRRLAEEETGVRRRERLSEATRLFEEAVTLALSNGHSGFPEVARFSHNLGNCLAQQRRFDAALIAFDRAEAYARRLGDLVKSGEKDEYLSMVLVHAAHVRRERGQEGDRPQAKRQLNEAIQIQHPTWIELAQLRLADMLVDEPASKEEGTKLLRMVRRERLRPNAIPEIIALYTKTGLRKEALAFLHEQINASLDRWRSAMADHTADHFAAQAQRYAHQAARLHLEGDEALEAFFTLEDVSGLRFVEALEAPAYVAKDPIVRVVGGHHYTKSVTAGVLETLAARLAHELLPLEALLQLARNLAAESARAEGPRSAFDDELEEILKRAPSEPDPVGFLRREALRIAEEVKQLTRKLQDLDPAWNSTDNKPWLYRLTREVVRDLLREYPGHALLRLSFAADLLVVAVWLDGDEVKTGSHRVDVPRGLFELLWKQRGMKKAPPELLSRIQADLSALDLSPALPPTRMAHAVLLPSFLGSFLPLGAIGPAGSTLLDRFDALSWIPCLAPLFIRQAGHRPREGTVSVAPGGTYHHAFAFGVALPGERRIEGAHATEERVREAATTADVMCLYTHGEHAGPHGPCVHLHGGQRLAEPTEMTEWAGMERLELWACQSGVNVSTDPLIDAVDEAFGLDVEFLRHGVRSAIGTLWSVPDLVTACIVRRYRRGLRRGLSAPHALADAQRFWRDEGASSLLRHLTSAPTTRIGLRAFQATLDADGGDLRDEAHLLDEAHLEELLGPAPSPGESERERIERQVQGLASPLAWAVFRFVGVADRRPLTPYAAEAFRPLTREEMADGERIVVETLRGASTTPRGASFDEHVERWLKEARRLAHDASPTPEQAIRVARLYRDRLVSSQRHNRLAALAWLHEAMVALKWTHHGARRREERGRLGIEAAWLWIEVATGDAIFLHDLVRERPRTIALERAKRMLDGAADSTHVRVARAWIALLEEIQSNPRSADVALRRAWDAARCAVESVAPDSHESVRTLTAAWDLAALAPDLLPDAVALAEQHLEREGEQRSWPKDLASIEARRRSAMTIVAGAPSPERLLHAGGADMLTERELARQTLAAGMVANTAPSHEAQAAQKRLNRGWDALEGALWGWPDDDRSPIWASTGTLGGAYRKLAGSLLAGLAKAPDGAMDAVQFLACLHPCCDVRTPLLRRAVWLLAPWENGLAQDFWLLAREREMLFEHLEDAALTPDLRQIVRGSNKGAAEPHELDPFKISAPELQKRTTSPEDLVPWELGEVCRMPPLGAEGARTAAFQAVRNVEMRTEELGRIWHARIEDEGKGALSEATGTLIKSFDPGLSLPARQDRLRQILEGALFLGLAIEPAGHLVSAALWNGTEGLSQRTFLSAPAVGFRVQELLVQLHSALLSDGTPAIDQSAGRDRAWRELCEILAPSLDAVLGPALAEGPFRIAVLAPGALRPLPLMALPVGGAPLYQRALSVVHVPTLSHEPPAAESGELDLFWCARARDFEDTSLGEATIETLCRWFEPALVEPPHHPTMRIEEVRQTHELGPRLAGLSVYASSTGFAFCPSRSGFALEGGRVFAEKNIRGLYLPSCEVELWVSTSGLGPMDAIRHDDRDRIPGLVGDFLACGAPSVLDLTWPVNDLVKALVCERFGALRRRTEEEGAVALRGAVASTADLLARWRARSSAFADAQEALGWLDERRRDLARSLGLDPRAVVPYASVREAPILRGVSVESLVEEACSPVHLAAFRYWTWT